MSLNPTLNQCAVCWKEGGQLCASCKSCHYCSKECQKADWKSHKLLCKDMTTHSERPSPFHVRAIYFPQDKAVPQLVWIPCNQNSETPEEPNHPNPDSVGEFIGVIANAHRVHWNYVHKKSTLRIIDFHFRDKFLYDGSKPTESLYTTVAKHGRGKFTWKGPLVVFSISVEDPPEYSNIPVYRYTDATLADFRAIIDHSLGYDESEEIGPAPLDPHAIMEPLLRDPTMPRFANVFLM
ncbi:uncharacterized protein F4817DRAFT_85270 [Daldinia loculata]|uniref:uncharacterized protein n=1 Tax=Daldinia loculata TaxID=103429 RepID=UPI0020C41C65|nr:uncharacterized protein F4817DRAFT_85270 [Daldinia loculata]KAI1651927.1 hypothetical protein F4817DRAFT_85270 [Daldinia loculata]